MDSKARGSKRRREARGSSAGIQRIDTSSVAWGEGGLSVPTTAPGHSTPGASLGQEPSLCPASSAPARNKAPDTYRHLEHPVGPSLGASGCRSPVKLGDRKGRGKTHPSAEQDKGRPPPAHAAQARGEGRGCKAARFAELGPRAPEEQPPLTWAAAT